ncbi:hypothetical protein [Nocardioides sp.]|uniref:hypothetical protein n=1 Tax=Nocardioides sp. TaxID=35761 RepID=UPI002B2791D9|nr:hypothetical protein [Nocardioides sp.]
MSGFDHDAYAHLNRWVQHGVVSRAQLIDLGATPTYLRRALRRDLRVVHPGVYVNHTGPLTWEQRAWAGVLFHSPAALAWESALPRPPRGGLIQVAVGHRSRITQVPGVHARRMAHLDERLDPLSAPPRLRLEHAAIDVASRKRDLAAAFQVFADACQTRETSAEAIAAALRGRARVTGKAQLLALLADLSDGACSVLEREYLLLERRHGLPRGLRQHRDQPADRAFYRDVLYAAFGIIVELDGRPFHDTAGARDRDYGRDLDTAIDSGEQTVRLTYGQVLRDGCATISKIGTLLTRRGWSDPFLPCPTC